MNTSGTSTTNTDTSIDAASPLADKLLGVLRIVTGYLFLLHGSAKLLKVPHIPMFDQLEVFSLYGLAGVLELVGGLAIVLGVMTRPVAFVLSGQMAVAYFMGHVGPKGNALLPLLNGGEAAVLFCFAFLYLFAAGGGAFSIDRIRAGR